MTSQDVQVEADSSVLEACRSVPPISDFPTIDELNSELSRIAMQNPDIAELRRVGTSRLGEPLMSLTISGGDANALVYAGVHPNEPIGFRTVLHLAEELVKDKSLRERLGYSWHILGCLDPDAARLNEGWYKGPFTYSNYGRHFYRPVVSAQPEYAFPFEHKAAYFDRMLPESIALMRLIDDVKPRFLCSLHNAEAGGAFFYLGDASDQLRATLLEVPRTVGVPFDLGIPETAMAQTLAPGIYRDIASKEEYDYLESIGDDSLEGWFAGGSASDYARTKYGTTMLVPETPLWAVSGVDDLRPGISTYAEVLNWQADALGDLHTLLETHLELVSSDLRVSSPFHDVTHSGMRSIASQIVGIRAQAAVEDRQHQATIADEVSAANFVHMYRMRRTGSFLRMLDAEIAAGNVTAAIRSSQYSLNEVFVSWGAEADAHVEMQHIPIERVVGIQYAAILATAAYEMS